MEMEAAIALLHPIEIFPNGPVWTKTGEPAAVCTRLGSRAFLNRAQPPPSANRSFIVTLEPSSLDATVTRETLSCRSLKSRLNESIAMSSEAAVMWNSSSRSVAAWEGERDVFGRLDPREPGAGRPALCAKERAHGGLAYAGYGLLSEKAEGVRKAD